MGFSRYTPQVVVVAIGQNDNHPVDYMAADPEGSAAEHWRKRYREFIEILMKHYPKAQIILATTILKRHPNWDAAIETVCGQIASERVHHFCTGETAPERPDTSGFRRRRRCRRSWLPISVRSEMKSGMFERQ